MDNREISIFISPQHFTNDFPTILKGHLNFIYTSHHMTVGNDETFFRIVDNPCPGIGRPALIRQPVTDSTFGYKRRQADDCGAHIVRKFYQFVFHLFQNSGFAIKWKRKKQSDHK